MSVAEKNYWRPDEAELLDKAFDAEGIFYSGSLSLVRKKKPTDCEGEEKQKPLTEKEQAIREYWQAKRDPVCWLIFNMK